METVEGADTAIGEDGGPASGGAGDPREDLQQRGLSGAGAAEA